MSISVIDGFGIGGGLGVGMSSDVIIATNRAKLAMSGASVGLGTFSSCVRNVKNFEYLAFLNAYGLLMSPYELKGHIVDYVVDFEKKEELIEKIFSNSENLNSINLKSLIEDYETTIDQENEQHLSQAEIETLNGIIKGKSFEEIQKLAPNIFLKLREKIQNSQKLTCPLSMKVNFLFVLPYR